ncbi:hypothetical protein [Arthrobacter celericrescens]|nr:hypothetical protein [Arthrobacter celericrescens]
MTNAMVAAWEQRSGGSLKYPRWAAATIPETSHKMTTIPRMPRNARTAAP